MPALRMRMDPSTSLGTGNGLLVRGTAERTREAYLVAGARLARFCRRSSDQPSPQEVQTSLVHLRRVTQYGGARVAGRDGNGVVPASP